MTVKTAAATDDFSKLLAEIGDVHKALPAEDDTSKDDAAIAAAAKEGEKPGDKKADKEKPVAEGDKEDVNKSYTIKLEDGTEVIAVDGTELIKSLTERLDAGETQNQTVIKQLFDIVKSQGAKLSALENAGKGRKAIVSIAEKTDKPAAGDDINKSAPGEISVADFSAKSMAAYTGKKINAHELNVVETCINSGRKIPDDIVRRVMAS